MVSLADVFGSSRGERLPLAYVERAVDDSMRRALAEGAHIAMYGTPGVGKSALIQKHIDASQVLFVECLRRQRAPDVYRSILSEAGARVRTETRLTKKRRLSGTLRIFSGETERGTDNTETEITIDLGNVGDVFRTLARHEGRPYIVLHDFHQLPRSTQRRLVRELQFIFERTDVRLILVGNWTSAAYLTDLNELLPSFLTSVPVPGWSDDELSSVLDAVGRMLNISFSPDLRALLIGLSAGSVRELTELSRMLLREIGVETPQHPPREIVEIDQLRDLAQDRVIRLFDRYQALLASYLSVTVASTEGVDVGRFLVRSVPDLFDESASTRGLVDPADDDDDDDDSYTFDELSAALDLVVEDYNTPRVEERRRRRLLIERLAHVARLDGSNVSVSRRSLLADNPDVALDEETFKRTARKLVARQAKHGFYPPLVAYDPRAEALVALEPKFRAFLRGNADAIGELQQTYPSPVDDRAQWVSWSRWRWRDPIQEAVTAIRWRTRHPRDDQQR